MHDDDDLLRQSLGKRKGFIRNEALGREKGPGGGEGTVVAPGF